MWLLPYVTVARCAPQLDAGRRRRRIRGLPAMRFTRHQHHRAENAAVLLEAGGEVRHLDAPALAVVQPCDEDRSIRHILLFAACVIENVDSPDADLVGLARALQQAAERGIAIEAGKATPDDFADRIDQRADIAVADQRQIEIAHEAFCIEMTPVPLAEISFTLSPLLEKSLIGL